MMGLAIGESPRWHEDRLWFSDWGAQAIVAAHADDTSEIAVRVLFALPFCIDWLRDGRLLIVSGREGLVMRRERDGSQATTCAAFRTKAGTRWSSMVAAMLMSMAVPVSLSSLRMARYARLPTASRFPECDGQ